MDVIPRGAGWRGVTLTVAATLAIVLSVTITAQHSSGSDTAPDRPRRTGVVPGPDMQEAANLERLVSQLQTVYGTTRAVRAELYVDHAVITTPAPGDRDKQRQLTYNGVFHRDVQSRPRARRPLVDLATVDWKAVARRIDDARDTFDVPDSQQISAVVRQYGDRHRLEVSGGSEQVTTTLDPIG